MTFEGKASRRWCAERRNANLALVERSPDRTTDPAVDVDDWEATLAFEVQQDHLEIIGEPGEACRARSRLRPANSQV